jgi:hypothetical protein
MKLDRVRGVMAPAARNRRTDSAIGRQNQSQGHR